MAPGVPHLLHKPKAAIDSGKSPGVKAEIHHPVEMPVGGIVRIGGSVPAERHVITLITPLILACDVRWLTKGALVRSDGDFQALVAQRIRASDYGSEGREFESLQARF